MFIRDTTVFCVGLNHKNASMPLREKLHLSSAKIAEIIVKIRTQFALQELVILSTCNRCELYGTVVADKKFDLRQAFCAAHRQLVADNNNINSLLYVYQQEEAIKHLFSVTASIDSLIIGETQIVRQVKEAFALAKQKGTTGAVMQQILQTALATSKKIRTETDIGNKIVSISHAAISLCNKIFTNIKAVKMLIVGAGEMAKIAARYACKQGVAELAVANRNLSRAEQLCKELGIGSAHTLDKLHEHLSWADVVITATTADNYLIQHQMVTQILKERQHHRPMGLIDISMPRNIEPSCQEMEDVYLFDLDDLKQITLQNSEARQQAVSDALQFVEKGVDSLRKHFTEREIGATVAEFKNFLLTLVEKQTSQTLSKSTYVSLTPQQRAGIQQLTDVIVNKIVGQVSMHLKDSQLEKQQVLNLFQKLSNKTK